MKNKDFMKRTAGILGSIVLYCFLGFCLLCVILTAFSSKDADGAATVMGYQIRLVLTDSMAACDSTDVSDFRIKSIPSRSLILLETVPEDRKEAEEWYAELAVGDVLTFRYLYNSQVTITHRIVSIEEEEGGYCITLLGDNKDEDGEVMAQVIHTGEEHSPNYVIGRVIASSYPLGWILSLLREPIGLLFMVILPATFVIIFELVRIFSIINAEKKRKVLEEEERKEAELEALRRRVAMLEGVPQNEDLPDQCSDAPRDRTDGERTA